MTADTSIDIQYALNDKAPSKSHVRRQFEKALSTYDQHAIAQQQINRRLLDMLLPHVSNQSLTAVLEMGCGSGDLSRLLVRTLYAEKWLFNDLSPRCAALLNTLPPALEAQFIAADAELLSAQVSVQSIDLLASASTVQWFTQPLSFIEQAVTLLRPNGLLLFNTFLPDNLAEIRALSGRGLTYPTLIDWQQRLSASFDLLALDYTPITLTFKDAKAVLQHLKFTGVTATDKYLKSRSDLRRFCQAYQTHFATDNGVTLTYSPACFLARYV